MRWRNFLNLPSARRPMFCLFHSIITKRALTFFPSCHFHLMMVNRKIIFNIASLFFSLSKSAKCENYWITMIICRVLIAARFWMLYKFVLCNSFTHFNKFTFWEQKKKFSWRNGKLNFMIFFAARTLSFHKNRENMSAKKTSIET